MTRPLGLLVLTSLALWVCLAGPAWLLLGPESLIETAVAFGLCLLPLIATHVWAQRAFAANPEQQVLAVLGGTTLRLIVVAGGGIALFHGVEALHREPFLFWVIAFYLVTLTLEVIVVVRGQNKAAPGSAAECR